MRATKVRRSRQQRLVFRRQWRAVGRYVGAAVRVYGAFGCEGLYCLVASFLTLADGTTTYTRHDRVGLDASLDVHRRVTVVAPMGGAVGQSRWLSRGGDCERGEP